MKCQFPQCEERATKELYYFSTRRVKENVKWGWGQLCDAHLVFLTLHHGLHNPGSGNNFEFSMYTKSKYCSKAITIPLEDYYGPF